MNQPASLRLRRSTAFRNSAGYTLFEIMLVLGIIAVLVGSAIYMLVGNVDIAKEQRVESDIKAISIQLRAYDMQNLRKPTTDPKPRKWRQLMETVPVDPWGQEYRYINPGKSKKNGFDLYSLGPDGVESADDIGK